jgi:hypothetical protein
MTTRYIAAPFGPPPPSEAQLIAGFGEDIARIVETMGVGETVTIERHDFHKDKRLFSVTTKGYD